MRRSLLAVAVLAVIVGCQDRQQMLGPGTMDRQFSSSDTDNFGNPDVWILGRTYTSPNGLECTFVEDGEKFGVQCGTEFWSWADYTYNTDLSPVVEICQLNAPGGTCGSNRAHFGKTGEIRSFNGENGKYRLTLDRDNPWWSSQGDGTYRVIVGTTYTGWETDSEYMLGYYEFTRSGGGNHHVQFRIRTGALCDNPDECAETSFDPNVSNTIVLDQDYELTEGEGIIGLKFPKIEGVVQHKVNIIIERIRRETERCIEAEKFDGNSGFAPGRELEPCYSIRTEPYIDLTGLDIEPIQFGVCLQEGAESLGSLLQMLKWSSVKNNITDMGLTFDGGFFDCPPAYDPNLAALSHNGTSRLARAAGRLLSPLASLVRPQPLHANFVFTRSPAGGSLMDFSTIVVQADDHYEAAYLSPIGAADPQSDANLGDVSSTSTVAVDLCLKGSGDDGCAARTASNSWSGTATWNATGEFYQANWNTPREQTPGTYRLRLKLPDAGYFIVAPDEINISFGTASYTHNPGRTLPIKFYLKRPSQ
jgi:hypothetical protein